VGRCRNTVQLVVAPGHRRARVSSIDGDVCLPDLFPSHAGSCSVSAPGMVTCWARTCSRRRRT
jgi:hypothetical protein